MTDNKKPERFEHTRAYWKIMEQRIEANLDRAPTYKSYSELDREAIRWIYDTKKQQGELEEVANEFYRGIEAVALLYKQQKCAFEDVLTREGFEPTESVDKCYSGRIAVLTHHGTFLILGKPKYGGRHVRMTRVHTPDYNRDGARGVLLNDLEINGDGPELTCGYKGSTTRALAINPYGADGDELESRACETIVRQIECETYEDSNFVNPYERPDVPQERVVNPH